MAKIKIKLGDNEVEIDSRDFYVDNQSIGQVISDVSKHLTENSASLVYIDESQNNKNIQKSPEPSLEYLKSLDDAEVHEPEFNNPTQILGGEVKSKLKVLEKDAFFNKPHTVSEIVEQLREYGWIASPLEVSKTLTKMVFCRELIKDSQNDRNYYSIKQHILTS